MGLFSKKPKSIIVQKPPTKAPPDIDSMDRLEQLLPKVEDLPKPAVADPPAKFQIPPKPPATPIPTPPGTPVVKAAPAPAPAPAPTPAPAPKMQPALRPAKPPKPNRKARVDPADFLALRAELMDMKARLDDSEKARAVVEARLGSLDATAAAFSMDRGDESDVGAMIAQLQQQLASRSTAEGDASMDSGAHDQLSAKIDALQSRLFGIQDHSPKIADLEAQLAELRTELDNTNAAAALAASLPPPEAAPAVLDTETLAQIAAMQQQMDDLDQMRDQLSQMEQLKQRVGEIDQLHERVSGVETLHDRVNNLGDVDVRLGAIDALAAQLQQLNARVAAQAELGGQIAALRDRMAQLGETRGNDDDIRLQLQEIGERMRAGEGVQDRIDELTKRVTANDNEARAVRDHMALLDQRLTNVSTELANQLSELGRDIDGLGQRIPEVAEGTVSEALVETLRGGQVKLASEQARYEIAFRQDLAQLAEQLRHGRPDSSNGTAS